MDSRTQSMGVRFIFTHSKNKGKILNLRKTKSPKTIKTLKWGTKKSNTVNPRLEVDRVLF